MRQAVSNADRAASKLGCCAVLPPAQIRKRSDARLPKKRGPIATGSQIIRGPRRLSQRKKATRTRSTKTAVGEIVEKRAKAYAEIEPHLCTVVNLGTIASNLFDCTDRGPSPRGDAGHLKARYYALDFQP